MSDQATFQELLARVRAGDQDAMTELVRRYEPAVRRTVRVRLIDARLRRVLDSSDVCQSVMKSLLKPAALERYKLDTPDDLLKLLARMTRNKLVDQVRRAKRPPEPPPPPPGPSPSKEAVFRELLALARERLSAEELRVWDMREAGLGWDEIAEQVGGTGEAVRKRMERAFDRVRKSLEPSAGADNES